MAKTRTTKRGWPARLVVAGLVTGAMLLTAILLIGISWFGSQQTLLRVAHDKAQAAAVITAERMRGMIAPAENILRSLAFDPIAADTDMPERLERLAALGVKLRANRLVSVVYIGYANGDFLAVRLLDGNTSRQFFKAPAEAAYLVQTVDRSSNDTVAGVYFFYDADYRLINKRIAPTFEVDPRVRPWYEQAVQTRGLAITQPYVFYSSRQVGVSLARRAHHARSVVGLDMTLANLSAVLSRLPVPDNTQLALVNAEGQVIGSRNGAGALRRHRHAGDVKLPGLKTTGIASLSRLWQMEPRNGVVGYNADGRRWLGSILPFHGVEGLELKLLVAIPASGLLGPLQRSRLAMIGVAVVLLLVSLPIGWWAGRRIGMSMEIVAQQAHRLSCFDFSHKQPRARSLLEETNTLRQVMADVADTMESFLAISHILGAEPDIETMLDKVLERFVNATRCDSGAVYLHSSGGQGLIPVASIGDQAAISAWVDCDVEAKMADADGLSCSQFDLRGRRGQLVGWLILRHASDWSHKSPEFLAFTNRLTGMLAVSVETRSLTKSQAHLFDSMVRVLADSIDAKSAYTGGHCKRVPEIATMLTDTMEADGSGPYADFALDDGERRSFHLAAWLHDAGKITSPEAIVDKATKLETVYNRIHEIRMRFEVLWRDADITCLKAQLDGRQPTEAATAERDAVQARLQDDFNFVAQCNMGDEAMDETAIQRLYNLASVTWLRYFDDRLGLSRAETQRLDKARSEPVALPAVEALLVDKANHLIPWGTNHKPAVEPDDPRNVYGFNMKLPAYRQDLGELHNLSVVRGTLSPEDRYLINDHVVQTLVMLKKLPWPEHLENVPELAAKHHERMDGAGYPRRLAADSLSTLDRVLALADVFEALTAPDRPYKPAKSVSTSLRIMAIMCQEGHLDTELYSYFLRKRVWQTYAERFVNPAQIDVVDVDALIELATGAA